VVAITDTSYGEDHCWTEHFACVVDINSPTPFSPIVPQGSPARAVHSASVLTREEQRRRSDGDTGYVDARRKGHAPAVKVELDREGLRTRLGGLLVEINRLEARSGPLSQDWESAHTLNRLMASSRDLLTAPQAMSTLAPRHGFVSEIRWALGDGVRS